MNLLTFPPEILIQIVGYLDIRTRNNFQLCSHAVKNIVDEPSVWRHSYLKLKCVDTKNRSFWKTLRIRQIRYLDVSSCTQLIPKHYEVILKYLGQSLVLLETQCRFIHINHHVLKQLCIGHMEELILHCGHSFFPCEGCETSNLSRFPKLKKLTLYNVTNAYFQHFSKDLCKISIPSLETLRIGMGVLNALCVKPELATALSKQSSLREVSLPKYTVVDDSFFTTYCNIDRRSSALSCLKLLGLSDFILLQPMVLKLRNSLRKLSICVNAERASIVTSVLSQLPNLTELGIKYESVPLKPDFYCLDRLPVTLSSLSLAFEITHTPVDPPCGQKLFHSGSKWFPGGVLPLLPKKLCTSLRNLWVATVKLSPLDVEVLKDGYPKLTTLTCRFTESILCAELLKICDSPQLHRLNVHAMGYNDKMAVLKKCFSTESKGRIKVFTCPKTLLDLPSDIPLSFHYGCLFTRL